MKTGKYKMLLIALLVMLAFTMSACDDDTTGQVKGGEIKDDNAGFVTVSNIDDLIAEIKPDAKILLKAGNYELSSASDYGEDGGAYYEWRDTYDGYEFVITGADNLTIKGEDDDSVKITARSTYANVINVTDCANVTLKDLTIGHNAAPGTCSGGVVMLENVTDGRIDDCSLYGCGVVGVDALRCKRLNVVDCEIYECSSIAVNANQSTDIRVTDCDIHDCGNEYGGSVFWMTGTTGFAAVDCDIENNRMNYLMYASYCPETYLLGCETEGNTFSDAVFWLAGDAPKIEGTDIHNNSFTAWYDSTYSPTPGLRCTDRAGKELTNAELENMRHSDCTYNGPVIPEITAKPKTVENRDGTRTVYVTTADELLAAIAPNTNIFLDTEEIKLTDASNYGSTGGKFYRWESYYDGPQLVIENCDDLSITSEIVTHIVAEPRYANVLTFEHCNNVWLSGFKAGHSVASGACTGGVIYMNDCRNMSVDGCQLYGCGIYGVCADNVEGLSVTGCEIYDCTQGAVYLCGDKNAVLEKCDIHDCAVPEISVYDCSGVSFVKEDGKGMYLENGYYTMDSDGMPRLWETAAEHEYIEPSLDDPYIDIYIGNALSNTLFLGENDDAVTISAHVMMPNKEPVKPNGICWICEDDGVLELDTYAGDTVTVKSNLKEGEATELYIYYLVDGSVMASTSVSVFGSRP